jgi:hypothetical protein
VGQHGPGAVDHSHQVNLEHAREGLGRDVLEAPEGIHAGIVEPDVDPAKALDRTPRQRLNLRLLGHVGGHRDSIRPLGPAGRRRILQLLLTAGYQNEAAPCLASARALALPMPLEAPVMTTTFPSMLPVMMPCSLLRAGCSLAPPADAVSDCVAAGFVVRLR